MPVKKKEVVKKEQHYIDNDLPVRFDVLVDGKPLRPSSVTIESYGPNVKYLATELVKPKSSEVFYLLDKKFVKEPGQYVFVFNCRLNKYGLQSHIIRVDVDKVPGRKK